MSVLSDLLRFKPLDAGEEVPPLSLTADEGTWIKIRDFKGHLNVVLVFYRSESTDTERYLKELETWRERFQDEFQTVIFAVNTQSTDRLREIRAQFRLGFYLLYDPMALTSRAYGVARKVRPLSRDAVYIIGKDQCVVEARREHIPVEEVARTLAKMEGKTLEPVAAKDEAEAKTSKARTPGAPSHEVQDIDSVKAVELLEQEDSPFILVDVRTKSEYDADHVAGSIFIPVDELPGRYQELGQNEHVIFVCQGGDRSAAGAEFMTSIGAHEIYNVLGGMSSWKGPRTRTAIEDQ